ncbi:FAD-dependent oxidoreductase [Aurantimonas sp. Leaf443]|uniref:FAD-dependent oxidoreductase n=1 Tax=Aurantimonas sp. Leaf443 TaxID=1736378 RepID=UPI0006FF0CB3|nr:FAD-dependent oxidoreductase [Aurantimonas sp. Leaf443]KQT88317.1 hypothetical protein ASG48_02515 [Aurantimonas sp. Leaf443]
MTDAPPPAPTTTRLVLLGAGHAHLEVLKAFADRPEPGLALHLVTPDPRTPYSGLLPALVEGRIGFEALSVCVAPLAARAGARLSLARASAIDAGGRRVTLSNGETIAYDLLSIDIGAVPDVPEGARGIAAKPIARFAERVNAMVAAIEASPHAVEVAVVGAGAAGVELVLALRARLRSREARLTLVGRSDGILPGRAASTRRRILALLAERGIRLVPGFDVAQEAEGALLARDGRRLAADHVLYATASAPPPLLRDSGLALDADGFVAVDRRLVSTSHRDVLAAGDAAALADPRPKAGVFAVRAGPVLAANLRALHRGAPLAAFRPQKNWLVILSTADGRAIADKWGLSLRGRAVLAWKTSLDTAFLDRYRAAP